MQIADCVDHHSIYLTVAPTTVHHVEKNVWKINTEYVIFFIIVHTDTQIPGAFFKLFKMFLKSRSTDPEGKIKGLEGLHWLDRHFILL